MQALDIARENVAHLHNVSTYWSYCINSYCDIELERSRDYESSKNSSFGNTSTSANSHADIPSLTTSQSYAELKKGPIIIGSDIIICGLENTTAVANNNKSKKNLKRRFEMS